jgi:catechol 2,3-dioxygenase-like lactoylglutathione lyase family enzyme
MRTLIIALSAAALVLVAAPRASAQLVAAKEGPVVYGHHHLTVSNLDAAKKFWVDAMGGTMVKVGTSTTEVVKLPNVLIFMRQAAPTGGTKGTTVNHIGFSVPNVRAAVAKIKAAGYPIVTQQENLSPATFDGDIATITATKANIAFLMGPDELKVELFEISAQTEPMKLHHVHFFGGPNAEMRAWYAKTFGATPRDTPNFFVAALPGLDMNFTKVDTPVVGTRGRSLDHLGFEVRNLEAFCKQLEAQGVKFDRPYTQVAALGIAIAFLTDPWGTYIELTEGLDKVN